MPAATRSSICTDWVDGLMGNSELRWFSLPNEIVDRFEHKDSTPKPADGPSGYVSILPQGLNKPTSDAGSPLLDKRSSAPEKPGQSEPSAASDSGSAGSSTSPTDELLMALPDFAADSDDEEEEAAGAVTSSTALSSAAAASLFPKIPKPISRLVNRARFEFDMIREGDRLLVGLSGGKDSLTMLHVLLDMRRTSRIKFDIGAVTVDPQFPGFDPRPLIPYLRKLGVDYFFESTDLMSIAQGTSPRSICSWCARMKRRWWGD